MTGEKKKLIFFSSKLRRFLIRPNLKVLLNAHNPIPRISTHETPPSRGQVVIIIYLSFAASIIMMASALISSLDVNKAVRLNQKWHMCKSLTQMRIQHSKKLGEKILVKRLERMRKASYVLLHSTFIFILSLGLPWISDGKLDICLRRFVRERIFLLLF